MQYLHMSCECAYMSTTTLINHLTLSHVVNSYLTESVHCDGRLAPIILA